MGSLLSTSSTSPAAEQTRILANDAKSPTTTSNEPLFLEEVKAEPATWSEESMCRTIQRFLGLLPDSTSEALKKEQQYPFFRRRSTAFVFDVGTRLVAIVFIQQLYRRYRRLRVWHDVSDHVVQLARVRLAAQRVQEAEEMSAASFRLLLMEGFSASKVCISGALKTIQLRLVLNPDAGECFLTWTPSRKKKPRINLHDIEQVIAVLKEGNAEAPRLSKKVSHRRGIIIVCKSYHRGRAVLEVATKQERNILLQGFQSLLSEMISTEPTLDDAGALRSQHPRRQSVIEFFSTSEEPQLPVATAVAEPSEATSAVAVTSVPPRRGSVAVYRPEPSEQQGDVDTQEPLVVTESARADAKAIEHFYQTRFDDSPPSQSRRPIEAKH